MNSSDSSKRTDSAGVVPKHLIRLYMGDLRFCSLCDCLFEDQDSIVEIHADRYYSAFEGGKWQSGQVAVRFHVDCSGNAKVH